MVKLKLDMWLIPEDISEEVKTLTFLDGGQIIPKEESGLENDTFEIKVEVEPGMIRIWTMNKTSQMVVARKYGEETDNWVGKQQDVTVKDQIVHGKDKKVIYAIN